AAINGFSHIFILNALEKKAGLGEGDILLKQVSEQECLGALERGEIDAGHTWEPTKSAALKKGYRVVCTAAEFPLIIVDVLEFRQEVIDTRGGEVKGVVAALGDAHEYLARHREEALGIMSRAMGMTVEEMDSGLKGASLPGIAENREVLCGDEGGNSISRATEIITDFYQRRGQLSKPLTYRQMVDPRFVEAAAAEGGGTK
ncbi:MAG TPA: hypothetical protein P5287_02915, partial [bacterium]|nr:hypothetical protein [bacterium]